MTVIDIDRPQPAWPIAGLLRWLRRRPRRKPQPDAVKLLDELNERLLADIGYQREGRGGLRNRPSAYLWMGRTPPGLHER